MGCTQSKIDNEEAVLRCKERKIFMKEAVADRNAFAAAHSAYAMSLKNTGAALGDYLHGGVQHPHGAPTAGPALPSVVQSHYETLPPPPPPLPNFPTPPPLQRAASMPEISVHKPDLKHSDPIIEEENEEEVENESYSLKHRSSRSSGGGGSRSGASARVVEDEGLAPPPPPRTTPQTDRAPPPPPPPSNDSMSWDFFCPPIENVPGPGLATADEGRIEREEMERKINKEQGKKVEVVDGGEGGGRRSVEVEPAEMTEKAAEPVPVPKPLKKVKQGASADGKRGSKGSWNVNLLQIFTELDDCFLKASESAHEVSKMLEANRMHYHSNFADNRGIML